jgi:hypothetical protein
VTGERDGWGARASGELYRLRIGKDGHLGL